MPNDEWNEYVKNKKAAEEERYRSRTLENVIRYAVFFKHMSAGYDAAVKKVDELCDSDCAKNWVRKKLIERIRIGIKGELMFYNLLGDRMKLTPTLDAGCAFDFVGNTSQMDEIKLPCQFVRIDVTTNINKKRETELTTCYGQKHWPFLVAHVKYDEKQVDWYDLEWNKIHCSRDAAVSGNIEIGMASEKPSGRFAFMRREVLEQIERRDSLAEALAEIKSRPLKEQKLNDLIEAEARFYSSYKYALNIVPALSCGDYCDFIGEHSGELIRYHVVTDLSDYSTSKKPQIQRLSQAIKYVVAVYDSDAQGFRFYNWDDYHLLADVPENFLEA